MQSPSGQKVLIYGTRANPLSFFLSRSLNVRLSASNVFCIDNETSRQESRLLTISENNFQCNELHDMTSQSDLAKVVDQNQITDIIDMTNRDCREGGELSKIPDLPESVRLFSPIFTTPLDISEYKANRQSFTQPVLPGIIYPFRLADYRFPCDLGTYLFYANFAAKSVEIDCHKVGVRCGQDLLELCMAKHAASFLTDLVVPDDFQSLSSAESSGVESSLSGSESEKTGTVIRGVSSASEESDHDLSSSEEDDRNRLYSVTISIDQLCKKLKKTNPHFSYSMINEDTGWSPEHDTDNLSSMKRQRLFCEQNVAEFLNWQQEDTSGAEANKKDKANF